MDFSEVKLISVCISSFSRIQFLLYVNDLIVVHEDDEAITQFGNLISKHFAVKDLGEISHYLGIPIERDISGNFLLNQSTKIAAVLDKFGMNDAKGASTPMEAGYLKLEGEYDLLPDNELYRQAVGDCCMWPPLLVYTLLQRLVFSAGASAIHVRETGMH